MDIWDDSIGFRGAVERDDLQFIYEALRGSGILGGTMMPLRH